MKIIQDEVALQPEINYYGKDYQPTILSGLQASARKFAKCISNL